MLGSDTVPRQALANAAVTLSCDQVAAEVMGALREAAVDSILLKGASIAQWLYPSGGRVYRDTDVLVRARDFSRAQNVLSSLGFADVLTGFHPCERSGQRSAVTFRRGPSARGPSGYVDLHRNLPMLDVPDGHTWQALSVSTSTAQVSGTEVRVLGRTALALHVALHAVQHSFCDHTGEDLRRAISAMSPEGWRAVADLAGRLGVAGTLAFGLRQDSAGAVVTDHLGLPAHGAADSSFWALYAPRGAAAFSEFRTAPTMRAKAEGVRWAVLPSPAKIRYVSGRPDARGASLAVAYTHWWRDLARATVPAARCAWARRRRARDSVEAR